MTDRKRLGDVAAIGLAVLALVVVGALVTRERSAVGAVSQPALSFHRYPVHEVERLDDVGNVIGNPDANLKLVEFSDFQCPFCRRLQGTLNELRSRDPQDLAVVYRQFPLSIHPLARAAAIASECAADQGQFSRYADLLFAKRDSVAVLSWEILAARAGVKDTSEFRRCRSSSTAAARVDTDIAVGTRLGITGTPALVVGNEMLIGVVPLDTLEAIVQRLSKEPVAR